MKSGDLVRLKVIPSYNVQNSLFHSLSVEVIWRAWCESPAPRLSESGREFKRGTPALFLHFDRPHHLIAPLAHTWALILIEGRVGWVSADDIESL